MRVHHLAIVVRELAPMREFYRHVLGLKEREPGRDGVAWFLAGEVIVMLEPVAAHSAPRAGEKSEPGYHLFALEIDPSERDAWRTKLVKHGIPIDRESDYSIFFRDPEGNRLALTHYPKKPTT